MESPAAYIPIDRRWAMVTHQSLPDRSWGAALFIDISGFTALTDGLVAQLGERRGADELLPVLNEVYGVLIAEVHRYGGSVIGFSGDAITCWFDTATHFLENRPPPADATTTLRQTTWRATTCAVAVQKAMTQFDKVATASGVEMSLGVKAAVAAGPVRRFLVGDPKIQYIDAVAGATLDRMAAAESLADKGEVVLGPQAAAILHSLIKIRIWRSSPQDNDVADKFAVINALDQVASPTPWLPIPANGPETLTEAQLQPWLLASIYERFKVGQAQFLAELRRTLPLFILFEGINYDDDDEAGAKLDAYIRWVQHVVHHYGGHLIQLTTGDKGAYLYASFGAPITYGDDARRATAAAIALRDLPSELNFISQVRIGLSYGRMRAGPCGGPHRRTYSVLGDEVNMAARLMQQAQPGEILISQRVAQAVDARFQLEALGETTVKGRSKPLSVFAVLDGKSQVHEAATAPSVEGAIGQYFTQINTLLQTAFTGQGQILQLTLPDDMRRPLMTRLVHHAQHTGFRVGYSRVEQTGPIYTAWRPIFARLLDMPHSASPSQQIAYIGTWIKATNPDWRLLSPLLGDLFDWPVTDNETTAMLDGPLLRQGALFALLLEIIQVQAQRQPLLLILDPADELDEASAHFAVALAQSAASIPLLLILAHASAVRPLPNTLTKLQQLPHVTLISTEALDIPPANRQSQTAQPSGRITIGRHQEWAALQTHLHTLFREGGHQVVIIEGEAGIGKSRLVADLLTHLSPLECRVLLGSGDAIEQATPYHAWRPIFHDLFSLSNLPDEVDLRTTHILAQLPATAHPEFFRLAPLLNAVLPIDIADNEFTQQMRGQVRADNTQALLVRLLCQAAEKSPLVLILEDAHWFDSASWSLAQLVSQDVQPLWLLIVTRHLTEPLPEAYRRFRDDANTHHLSLDALSDEEITALICQRLNVKAIPEAIAAIIHQRAEGHPFFSEELAYALRDEGVLVIRDGECHLAHSEHNLAHIKIPDTIEGLITSRIDRLNSAQQLMLKIASVIGRIFPVSTLRDVHPTSLESSQINEYLNTLQRLDITYLETPEPDLSYIFKHIITQEVTYNLMVSDQRQRLHRLVATWYEKRYARDLTAWYPLLAHHWRRANETAIALAYFEQAGEQALHNGAYLEAIHFFQEALLIAQAQLMPQTESSSTAPYTALQKARWQRYLGEAYLGLGQLVDSQHYYEAALSTLHKPVPATNLQLLFNLGKETGRQVLHRLALVNVGPRHWLTLRDKLLKIPPTSQVAQLEAARAYEQLTEIYYYANRTIHSAHAGLQTLNLAERAAPSPELARAYANLCIGVGLVPIHPLAKFYSREAMKLAGNLRQETLLAYVLSRTSLYSIVTAQWAQAQRNLQQAIKISEKFRHWRQMGESLVLLAMTDYAQSNFEHSRQLFKQLLDLGQRTGNIQHQGWALNGEGLFSWQAGDATEAIKILEEARPLFSLSSDRVAEILCDELLALAYLRAGHPHRAQQLNKQASDLIAEAPPTPLSAFVDYIGVALVYLTLWEAVQGRDAAAERKFAQFARRACRVLRLYAWVFPVGQGRIWLTLGLYYWLAGKSAEAHQAWRKSLALAEHMAMPYEQGLAHYEIGRHLPTQSPERNIHLSKARDIFEMLKADYDLAAVQQAIKLDES